MRPKVDVGTLKVQTLLSRGRYTIWQLSQLVGVSGTSITRYLEALRRAGVALRREPSEDGSGRAGLWWIE